VSQLDFLVSFASLLDVEIDSSLALDSQDNLKALLGEDSGGLPFMLEEGPRGIGVRQGTWKLMTAIQPNQRGGNKNQLYNLEDDLGEEKNLIEEYPEKVSELLQILESEEKKK